MQYPGASGRIIDFDGLFAKIHEFGGLAIASADLMALTLLCSPGEAGADVVCGTSQRFVVPMGFCGPHSGYLAVRENLVRSLPGRPVGISVDAVCVPASRLTLPTHETADRRKYANTNF